MRVLGAAVVPVVLASAIGVSAVTQLCGKFAEVKLGNYTINNNAWNSENAQASTGSICTFVPENAPNNAFYSVWSWPGAPIVKAFPNIRYNSGSLPLLLSDVHTLELSASWNMVPVSSLVNASASSDPGSAALNADAVEANVALDLFLDEDEHKAVIPSQQKYEFMVWFGTWGRGALPVGNAQPNHPEIVVLIGNTEFKLFNGTNPTGQYVFTWVANETLTSFTVDAAPLLGFLVSHGMLPADVFVGSMQFGSEVFASNNQINFSVSSVEMGIQSSSQGTSGVNGTDSGINGTMSSGSGGGIGGGSLPTATPMENPTSSASWLRGGSFHSMLMFAVLANLICRIL